MAIHPWEDVEKHRPPTPQLTVAERQVEELTLALQEAERRAQDLTAKTQTLTGEVETLRAALAKAQEERDKALADAATIAPEFRDELTDLRAQLALEKARNEDLRSRSRAATAEMARMSQEWSGLEQQITEAQETAGYWENSYNETRRSMSWRLTAPVRAVSARLARRRGGGD